MDTNQITLITVIISGVASVLGNYFVYIKRSKINLEEQAKRDQYYVDKIADIDKKLEEHNGYAKLFRKNADDIASIKSDNRVIVNDIKYLKEEIQNVKLCKIPKK